ncbi:MAG: DUF1592 domain-containing protein [Planctomycetota bacterium]|nr:DUF1592 domain-containing protein [Planctomycetota bacterium]
MDPSKPVFKRFAEQVQPLLTRYCVHCHGEDESHADIDFGEISRTGQVADSFEVWKQSLQQIETGTMPPEDQPQPSPEEKEVVYNWYEELISSADPGPAAFQPRRLSVQEFRNTLRSVIGFDLEVAVVEAEQTVTEKSMVVKLLPVDPPGESGFKNDTHRNPLTLVAWDQYGKLVDAALEELFSESRRMMLEKWTGHLSAKGMTSEQAAGMLKAFIEKAWRRPVDTKDFNRRLIRMEASEGQWVDRLKTELKTVLLSPAFLYRGMRMPLQPGKRHPVDNFELAERLSYFVWSDMPDAELFQKALDGALAKPEVLERQLDRMLKSPRARALSEIFALEWLTLDEIEKLSNNPPQMVALKSQPLDFLNYLFRENRPLLEMIDSDVAFANPFTSRFYGNDSKQMKRYVKQRGIEVEIVPNQKIRLVETKERGGILTMPGVLSMNRGPILRGTWVLERILGEELPEPPPNVGNVPGNPKGRELSFRQRFEMHRSKQSCAVCHDRIDPLGFAFEGFNAGGNYVLRDFQPTKKEKKRGVTGKVVDKIDTSGQLPSGEKFNGIVELKTLLTTTQRRKVITHFVEKTMSFALCRKLGLHDQPTVRRIAGQMDRAKGSWRDLFLEIVNSSQFRETRSH